MYRTPRIHKAKHPPHTQKLFIGSTLNVSGSSSSQIRSLIDTKNQESLHSCQKPPRRVTGSEMVAQAIKFQQSALSMLSARVIPKLVHSSVTLIPRCLGLGLWDSILRAVPKKKTTHSKTRMRSATKGLKDRTNINNCSACGQPKLSHYVCGNCFREIRHRWAKTASRALGLS